MQRVGLVLLFIFATVSDVRAAAGPWVEAEHVKGRIISAVDGTGELDRIPVGIEIEVSPGWKTYWRSPGSAGLPPRFDWANSQNLDSAVHRFPAPKRFQLFGLQTFGYSNTVVFPVTAAVQNRGAPLDLKVDTELLVCEKICVPQTLRLALSLPASAAQTSEQATTISRFQNSVPRQSRDANIKVTSAKSQQRSDDATLAIDIRSNTPLSKPDAFVELDPPVSFKAPVVVVAGDGHAARLEFATDGGLPDGQSLDGRKAIVTVVDGAQAFEQSLTIEAGHAQPISESLTHLMTLVALAVLGGLVLNVMPCVLPVLSIKLMSVLKHSESSLGDVRRSFLATSAGIICSMLVIAAGLIALKAAGHTIGWGIQFQQPVFIAAMAAIIMLFACNLWGFFEILLPDGLANRMYHSGERQGLAGDFWTGAFATLLATPCSAPFVGTAVGFALSGSALQVVLIFFALGFGLALPYLAVALRPSLVGLLPKPGPWMVSLRVFLGFALAATAVWLLTVLAGQIGHLWMVAIAGLLVVMTAVLAFHGRIRSVFPKLLLGGVIAMLLGLIIVLPGVADRVLVPQAHNDVRIDWKAFDRSNIRSLVAQGKTVFVDVTADWCIICQTNKSVAMHSEPVSQRLSGDVVAMRADWTLPDQVISDYLASHGRYGVPLNVVYGPRRPDGVVLPELLTADIILNAIGEASLVDQQAAAASEKRSP